MSFCLFLEIEQIEEKCEEFRKKFKQRAAVADSIKYRLEAAVRRNQEVWNLQAGLINRACLLGAERCLKKAPDPDRSLLRTPQGSSRCLDSLYYRVCRTVSVLQLCYSRLSRKEIGHLLQLRPVCLAVTREPQTRRPFWDPAKSISESSAFCCCSRQNSEIITETVRQCRIDTQMLET